MMASNRELVSMGIFASDQHKPSVLYEEQGQIKDELLALGSGADRPPAPSNPEVMEVGEDLVAEPDLLADWRTLYLNWLLRKVLLMDKMEA